MLVYIGPGGALTMIGSLLALAGSVVFAAVGVVWYPILRVLQRLRRRSGLPSAVVGESPKP